MTRQLCAALSTIALGAVVFGTSGEVLGATILKLNLGNVSPDIGMPAPAGTISTVPDGNVGTTGDQNTDVEYTGFLDGIFADINTPTASFTTSGLQAVGPPTIFGSLVIQNYFGGTFNLYDPSNTLLLSGSLVDSALTGTIGVPGTGAVFTTTFGTATGGTLLPYVVPGTVNVSMNLTDVNDGLGFLVLGNVLQPFTADASVNISAESSGIPEPGSAALVVIAMLTAGASFVRPARQ
jgi:hypothetical protein